MVRVAGFAYDSSPVTNSDRSIVLPLDRQYRYALGLQYELRKNITLGAAYEYMDAGSAPVNQTGGPLKGDLKGRMKDDVFQYPGAQCELEVLGACLNTKS